jgi:hypothetical protein
LHFLPANAFDILDFCARIGHADMQTLKKYRGKLKNPYVPVLKLRRVDKLIKEMESVAQTQKSRG